MHQKNINMAWIKLHLVKVTRDATRRYGYRRQRLYKLETRTFNIHDRILTGSAGNTTTENIRLSYQWWKNITLDKSGQCMRTLLTRHHVINIAESGNSPAPETVGKSSSPNIQHTSCISCILRLWSSDESAEAYYCLTVTNKKVRPTSRSSNSNDVAVIS